MQLDAVGSDAMASDQIPELSYTGLQETSIAMGAEKDAQENDTLIHALRDIMDHP